MPCADLLPCHMLQVSHDEMRAAMGLSPRPTSAPVVGGGPRLTPPCGAKVYLPKPSAPLPPGATPFMGALSGYFGVSPPAAGVELDHAVVLSDSVPTSPAMARRLRFWPEQRVPCSPSVAMLPMLMSQVPHCSGRYQTRKCARVAPRPPGHAVHGTASGLAAGGTGRWTAALRWRSPTRARAADRVRRPARHGRHAAAQCSRDRLGCMRCVRLHAAAHLSLICTASVCTVLAATLRALALQDVVSRGSSTRLARPSCNAL